LSPSSEGAVLARQAAQTAEQDQQHPESLGGDAVCPHSVAPAAACPHSVAPAALCGHCAAPAAENPPDAQVLLRGSWPALDLERLLPSLSSLGHGGDLAITHLGRSGTLVLEDGRVVGARFGAERGRAAFEAILLVLSSGDFSFSLSTRAAPAVDELGLSGAEWRAYLADLLAERDRLWSVVASPAAVARVAEAPDARRDFPLHHSAVQTLLAVDGRRSVEELADSRGLARTMFDLAELAHAGLVVVGPPPASANARQASPLGLSWHYLVFLAGLVVSKLGDALYTFALPWLALELTGSPLVMGTLYATEVLPVVVFGPLIGVLVDRWDRRRLLLAADISRAGIVSIIPLLHAVGRLELAHLYVVGFALALISLAFDVGTTAAVPEIAGNNQLTRANAAHQLVTQVASTGGPVVAGVLVTAIGASSTLWIDSVSYAGTILAVLILPALTLPRAGRTASGVLRGMLEGMRWLWTSRPIRALSLQAMIGNFGFGMIMAVFLYYLSHTLGLSAELSGIDYALLEVGGVLGTLAIVPLDRRVRRGRLYSGIIAWGTLGLVLTLQLRGWWWAPGVGMAIVLSGNLAWTVLSTSVRQELIPAELRGRVLSCTRVLAAGCMPLGAALGGLISEAFDPSLVFVVAIVAKVVELLITRFSSIREL
jgi:MFS family permease